MASKTAQVADAVCTALNAATLSQTFTAEYRHAAYRSREDLGTDIKVLIATPSAVRELVSRGEDRVELAVAVAVLKALQEPFTDGEADEDELDECQQLAEEIADFYGPGKAGGIRIDSPEAVWIRTEHDPLYDSELLATDQVFFSVILFTFKLKNS